MWDDLPDEKRELLLAYDQLVCPQCGNLREECADEMVEWHPRTDVCHATAAQQWGQRVLQEKYAKVEAGPLERRYLDARWVYVTRQEPTEGDDEIGDLLEWQPQASKVED